MSNKNLFVSISESSKPNEKQISRITKEYVERKPSIDKEFKQKLEGNNYAGYGKISEKVYDKTVGKVDKKLSGKKFQKKVYKALKTRMSSKKILKPNKMTVKIEEYKAPSVLGDENRFFKGEYEKEKRSLFFS